MNMKSGTRLAAYKAQQEELVRKYEGKIIAMVDGHFVGVYETKIEALADVQRKFPNGSYFIIKCTSGDSEYTRRLRSRSLSVRGVATA